MSAEKGKMKLEKLLRNNLISAYLDYVREFGEEKALQVFEQAFGLLKDRIRVERHGTDFRN